MIDIDIILLVLKLGILALLYLFIWRVVRAAVKNVRGSAAPIGQAPDVVLPAPVPSSFTSTAEESAARSARFREGPAESSSRAGPRLVVDASPSAPAGAVFRLTGALSIGRGPGNDIVVNETVVSGTHARLVPRGLSFVVEDLGSTNGTFVDDNQVKEAQLRDRSRLRIGDTIFRYEE